LGLVKALEGLGYQSLAGTAIVDHFADGKGTEFALSVLELDSYVAGIDRLKDLPAEERAAVRRAAVPAFEQLVAESARRR
jgi:hypothetical protein